MALAAARRGLLARGWGRPGQGRPAELPGRCGGCSALAARVPAAGWGPAVALLVGRRGLGRSVAHRPDLSDSGPWRREGRARKWSRRSGQPRSPAPPSSAGSWTAPSRPTCSTRMTSASPFGTRRRKPPCTSWWSRDAPSRALAAWPRAMPSSWDTYWWSPARPQRRKACRRAIEWLSTMASTGHSPSTTSTSTCWGGAKWAGRLAE